ncbi:MAG: phosphoribosylformylglycinamidine cyclo-ligase [Alphaproteobacteria bacterium]|nr:AIR synthase-related protein [Alphaproteobacteria bacterium]TAD87390.1 MAG: phosphoribosylformylglycinamidine cyclo-ligase [Alphaproteobacteria bacterium]
MSGLTYQGSGVDYDLLDAFKRECQAAAGTTRGALAAHGLTEPPAIRGESAYLVELPHAYLAHVEEGLGTKNIVADAVLAATGRSFYREIGIDTVATIVNDLVTSGARPLVVAMHAAVGDAEWFRHDQRRRDLAAGFAEGCRLAGAVWGGGETPALKGLVQPDAIVLAGSGIGLIEPKARRIVGDVAPGDAILFLAASGVHANGLTLCRRIADSLPEGYQTPIGDGRTYGEALLAPTPLYANAVAAVQDAGITLRYAVNITGHGWRKLMRLAAPLTYQIDTPGDEGALFRFLRAAGPIDLKEAYGTYTMGAGFALIVRASDAAAATAAVAATGHRVWHAGTVLAGERSVTVPSLGLAWADHDLALRDDASPI